LLVNIQNKINQNKLTKTKKKTKEVKLNSSLFLIKKENQNKSKEKSTKISNILIGTAKNCRDKTGTT